MQVLECVIVTSKADPQSVLNLTQVGEQKILKRQKNTIEGTRQNDSVTFG